MKSLFQKSGALLLAMLILLATTSFSVNMHYCGSQLVAVSLNKPAKKCCAFKVSNQNSFFKTPKKSCCSDTEFTKLAEDTLTKTEQSSIALSNTIALFPTPFYNIALENPYSSYTKGFSTYHPPLIPINRQISYQVFLI